MRRERSQIVSSSIRTARGWEGEGGGAVLKKGAGGSSVGIDGKTNEGGEMVEGIIECGRR